MYFFPCAKVNPRVSLFVGIFIILAVTDCFICQPLSDEDKYFESNSPAFYKDPQKGRLFVNQVDWTDMGSIRTQQDVAYYPIVNVNSIRDEPLSNASRVPYLYETPMGVSAEDLAQEDQTRLMMTLARGSFCKNKNHDTKDSSCPKVILTEEFKKVEESSSEYDVAKTAILERHPWLLADVPEKTTHSEEILSVLFPLFRSCPCDCVCPKDNKCTCTCNCANSGCSCNCTCTGEHGCSCHCDCNRKSNKNNKKNKNNKICQHSDNNNETVNNNMGCRPYSMFYLADVVVPQKNIRPSDV